MKARQDVEKVEKNLMLLSPETLLGLKMTGKSLLCTIRMINNNYVHIIWFSCVTVKSFVELVRQLFSLPDVKVFLSEKLCQDPLENFFGCQRQRGGVNDNPTVQQFYTNTQALRTINEICHDVRGNCRGLKRSQPIDWEKESAPLPKRRKVRTVQENSQY